MLIHAMTDILRQQEQEIREVIETVHETIDHQTSDTRFFLLELKEILIGLLQDHYSDTDHLAKELGVGHDMVLYWDLRLDGLVGEAKEAIDLTGIFLTNEEDREGDMAEDSMHSSKEILTMSVQDIMQPRTDILIVSQPDTM